MDLKAQAREKALSRRNEAAATPAAVCGHTGERLRDNFFEGVPLPHDDAGVRAPVSGYVPVRGEIDVMPLLTRLADAGHTCGLPVMHGKGNPLTFLDWQPGMEMVPGTFGIATPPGTSSEVIPALLLVPLLAFDDNGYRLGYGGGFYDRTLMKLRKDAGAGMTGAGITAVGVAYEAQHCASLPLGEFDEPLDWIVTEEGVRRFARDAAANESLETTP